MSAPRIQDGSGVGLASYGFRRDEQRGIDVHPDGRAVHWRESNWTLILQEGPDQKVVASGNGLQALLVLLALTHREKSIVRQASDLIPYARLNEPSERPPR